jgi:3-dehydroquinate dehydratase II
MKILIINGPNLNLLGKREPEIYGNDSFEEYLELLRNFFPAYTIQYTQSNVEGELINALQDAENNFDNIVLNAGGYTHTSVALADAVKAIVTPVVEVHITNLFARERYRHTSLIAPWCKGTISGFGLDSYRLAILSFS